MAVTASDVLIEYGNKFVEAFRNSLIKNNKFVSGNLSSSIIAMPLKFMGQKIVLEIRANDYFNYVNDGVNGTLKNNGSPFSFRKKNINRTAMLRYIASRGINSSDIENYYTTKNGLKRKRTKPLNKKKALNTLAFLIGRGVSKKGIKPTHFADDVLESGLKEEMEKELSKTIGRLITVEIKKEINGNNNNKRA